MAKRQTTVRYSKITDRQIQDFVDNCEMTAIEVIAAGVAMFHAAEYERRKSAAVYAPIYQQYYVQCKAGDGGFFVTGENYDTYLRPVCLDEITPDTMLYVEVKHSTKWPYSGVDFIEPLNEIDAATGNIEPRRFCEAALVATPKLSLT